MQSPRTNLLLSSAAALCLASCAADNPNDYDTSAAYGAADYGQSDTTPSQPVNPVYDTPAAYEEPSAPTVNPPGIPSPAPTTPAPSSRGTVVHTVAKGDTLWGLSKKYNVTIDSIKKANGLTKDTVVLGSKLQIPAR